MRLFYNLCIIIFVILSLYIVRDDVVTVYERTLAYVHSQWGASDTQSHTPESSASELPRASGEDAATITSPNPLPAPDQKSANPGPLRVADSYLVDAGKPTILSAQKVIALTNQNRASIASLPALVENTKLDTSASLKLADMFAKQYFEHVSPNGTSVSDLGSQVGYAYIIIGENLALGNFKDDKALVDAWMASPGHRANILNKHYSQIGVAVGHGMFNGTDTWLAVQHFGLSQDACPAIDEALRNDIVLDQKTIKAAEADLVVRKSKIDSGVVYEGNTTDEQITIYNELVVKYNKFVMKVKNNIEVYNRGVKAFNGCVTDNTVGSTHNS